MSHTHPYRVLQKNKDEEFFFDDKAEFRHGVMVEWDDV